MKGKRQPIVTGAAFSCGSLVAAACDKVQMFPSAMMMVHGPESVAIGSAKDMERHASRLRKEGEAVSTIYKRRMDDGMVDGLLKEGDHFFTASECMENGLCDSIVEPGNGGRRGQSKPRQGRRE